MAEKGDMVKKEKGASKTSSLDIIEHKLAAKALGESEELYRSMIELSPDGVVAIDAKGMILVYNIAASRMSGYSKDEIVGRHFSKVGVFRVKDTPKYLKIFSSCLRGKTPKPFEMTVYRKDGTTFLAEVNVGLLRVGGKKIIQAVVRDATERKQMEEELKESEERYRDLVQNALDIIFTVSLDGTITSLNAAFETITGWSRSEWIGKPFATIVHPDDLPLAMKLFQDAIQQKASGTLEARIVAKSGEYLQVEVNSTPLTQKGRVVGFWSIARDLTERKRMEEELRKAQEQVVRSERLAAIGQLAGGVGHELRNPLGAIKNAAYYVKGKVAKSELAQKEPRVIEFLNIMDDEINACTKIINDLLGFSRVGKPSVSPTQINNVIEDALSRTTIPENIELVKKLDAELPQVEIDASQIQQVVVNMISNAVQAMPEGGELKIGTKKKEGFLEVEIADTGCGIPKEARDKIFDPLFTTRAKGIGLGLAVCKAIIDRHEGKIEVKSQVEKGTTFIIKLPLKKE